MKICAQLATRTFKVFDFDRIRMNGSAQELLAVSFELLEDYTNTSTGIGWLRNAVGLAVKP